MMNRAHNKQPANVIPLKERTTDMLYQDVLVLAEMIKRGELTGVSYSAITRQGTTVEGVLGKAKVDVTRAHYGVSRLAAALLNMARY